MFRKNRSPRRIEKLHYAFFFSFNGWWVLSLFSFFVFQWKTWAFRDLPSRIRHEWPRNSRLIQRNNGTPFLQNYRRGEGLPVAMTSSASFTVDGGASRHTTKTIIQNGGVFRPNEILYPCLMNTPVDDAVPLFLAIRRLRQAVSALTQQTEQLAKDEKRTKGRVTVRIEQSVSRTIDPLAWLHAQINLRDHHSLKHSSSATFFPVVYFSNGEDTHEVSGLGNSGLTFCGANNATTLSPHDWQIIQSFPSPSMRVYGGARFDCDYASDGALKSLEWEKFSNGCDYFFTLPALELLREKDHGMKLAINMHFGDAAVDSPNGYGSLAQALESINALLQTSVTERTSPMIAPSLPAITERYDSTTMEKWEDAIKKILSPQSSLQKCVLARSVDLTLGGSVHPLDVLRKMKYGVNSFGGAAEYSPQQQHRHLFYLCPTGDTSNGVFLGSTPERLFRVQSGTVTSEALAGTQLRGIDPESDAALSQELLQSSKDMSENTLTMDYIITALDELESIGLLQKSSAYNQDEIVFIRRLRHLQHLCRRIQREISNGVKVTEIAHMLLDKLHPTPAVCGYPVKHEAMKFIRENEPFDRGFFSGPFGFFGRNDTDVLVAIRSCLIRQLPSATSVILFAGAGIVPGSTPQSEYIETAHKLSVISSLFPPSPFSLQGQPNANAAFSAAFVEELIRNGITDFFICPGSRSTPLSVAIVRASRQIHRVGSIRLHSCIDERGAVYRAIGYFLRSGRVPVIVTTSGTAVSNLAPGVSEASVSGTPMILLTADRPYDQIGVGADQAIDQVKAFGCYVRFFRDIQAPSQEAIVPVHNHLSDASHGLQVAINQRGPVHFNIQFRENLAPDPEIELIRGDPRKRRHQKFDSYFYTDVPGWDAWSRGGQPWFRSFSSSATPDQHAVNIILRLLQKSRRAILVVGNVRPTVVSCSSEDSSFEELVKTIEFFATTVGMPIVPSCQRVGCALRFSSAAVLPFAEYVLSHPIIASLIKPDLIIQLGHPLVGSISSFIDSSMRSSHVACTHVLIHDHYATERAAPTMSASIVINGQLASILSALLDRTDSTNFSSNELAPLVLLGRLLQTKLPKILLSQSASVGGQLTEPQIMLANAQFSTSETPSFFWSNSMPIRDAEAFFYPLYSLKNRIRPRFVETAANRGANGIDGIISTAQGYASQTGGRHTNLIIGDVAALHDLNALHVSSISPLSIQLINNGGGNIFSFLPIRKHGESVGFEEFWSTPQTRSVNYSDVARGMGMQVSTVSTYRDLCNIIRCKDGKSNKFIECNVVGHDENVELHGEIRRHAHGALDSLLGTELSSTKSEGGRPKPSFTGLPIRIFEYDSFDKEEDTQHAGGFLPHGWRVSTVKPGDKLLEKANQRNILFLHGWMGDQLEWDDVIPLILKDKRFQDRSSWRFITMDLPGHGAAPKLITTEHLVQRALNFTANHDPKTSLDLEWMASSILSCLQSIGLKSLDAICGYSLGGRIGLRMKLLAMLERQQDYAFLSKRTKLILLSANAEPLLTDTIRKELVEQNKISESSRLLLEYAHQSLLFPGSTLDHWAFFLTKWYKAEIWSNLHERLPQKYARMAGRRLTALQNRCFDFELVLSGCDSSSNPMDLDGNLLHDFQLASDVLYIAGSLDTKYVDIGHRLRQLYPGFSCVFLPDAGHAVLTESPEKIASELSDFLFKTETKGLDELERSTLKKAADSPADATITTHNKVGLNFHQELIDRATVFITPLSIEMFPFSFSLTNGKNSKNEFPRIGWRNLTGDVSYQRERCGIVIQVTAYNAMSEEIIGVGEIAPLSGLHKESLLEAEKQMQTLKERVSKSELMPPFAPKAILSLEGEMNRYLDKLASHAGMDTLLPSVASGLEMALISLSSNAIGITILESLAIFTQTSSYPKVSFGKLPINALMAIDNKGYEVSGIDDVRFQSIKVKIGHEPEEDARRIIRAMRVQRDKSKHQVRKVRADANRAWDVNSALSFARLVNAFRDADSNSPTILLEFIEEPLAKRANASLEEHMYSLSEFYKKTGVAFALDETVYDVVNECKGCWEKISSVLRKVFSTHDVGCAAVVLKPSLLGMELSLRISRLARVKGISAVFSSSFESGIGLGYIAMLAAISDAESSLQNSSTYAHGLGTFEMISGDILSPPFARLVNSEGEVDTYQLSRILSDLSLEAIMTLPDYSQPKTAPGLLFNAISSQMKGRTITLHASLSLPFSDSTAHERFTNLPQMPRWCPWLKSVEFISASETEWKLNVVGRTFTWRAYSSITSDPKGIVWESLSGLRNSGVVEFLHVSENECTMVVLVSFLAPQGIERLFEGIFEDFLRNKLLKWSLEMFRDAVKGDLALERGEVELGDALSDAVEGRASVLSTAFEATMSAFAYNQTSGDFL